MYDAKTSGAPFENMNSPVSDLKGIEHSAITLMRFSADENGYLCLTFTTIPFPACTAQQSDGVDDVADGEALLFIAEFNAASLLVQWINVTLKMKAHDVDKKDRIRVDEAR